MGIVSLPPLVLVTLPLAAGFGGSTVGVLGIAPTASLGGGAGVVPEAGEGAMIAAADAPFVAS